MGGSREAAGQIVLELAPFSSVALNNCRIVREAFDIGTTAFCVLFGDINSVNLFQAGTRGDWR